MKKIVAAIAILSALLVAGCSTSNPVRTVDPRAFLSVAGDAGVVVIDVRTPQEYAAGHLVGAINIDVEGPTFDGQLATLDKSKTYAVYCHSGRRSKIATDSMAKAHFLHVYNLAGGYPDLLASGASVTAS